MATVDVMQVSSAGVTLMSARHSGPVCFSDYRAGTLDELQFSLGEGPCPDAYASRVPVFEPDLDSADRGRWPNFTPFALELGTRGVFAFPLHAGSRCIGVLTVYQNAAGTLTRDQIADGLCVADALTESMLTLQTTEQPSLPALERTDSVAHRAEFHQASGMVAVQLGISVPDASVRIRAHAFATSRSVTILAQDIVARRIRLGNDIYLEESDE
jgi:GAF domain-containing protein